jgi:hypothetical protein
VAQDRFDLVQVVIVWVGDPNEGERPPSKVSLKPGNQRGLVTACINKDRSAVGQVDEGRGSLSDVVKVDSKGRLLPTLNRWGSGLASVDPMRCDPSTKQCGNSEYKTDRNRGSGARVGHRQIANGVTYQRLRPVMVVGKRVPHARDATPLSVVAPLLVRWPVQVMSAERRYSPVVETDLIR